MAYIDKSMYDNLKSWCDRNRPDNQYVLYVNSQDRALTNATVRKLMNDITNEDIHGEEYIAFYSSENFYHNMLDYFFEIDELYMHHPKEDSRIEDVIRDIPSTCGWITLIVEDIEVLSDRSEIMQDLIKALFEFATRRSNIIIIGNGDYKDAFSECEYAFGKMTCGINAKEQDNIVMVGCYNQETNPDKEFVTYTSPEEQCDELVLYWDFLYEQIDKKYFDYEDFKTLFRDTLDFLIPRVTKELVYRKDLWLIENIGAIRRKEKNDIEGCKPWEFEAAQKMAKGLHEAIINSYDDNDDFSKGEIYVEVVIENREQDHGAIHISSSICPSISISVDNVCQEMDSLAETILECTYNGDSMQALNFIMRNDANASNKEIPMENMEKLNNTMNALMDGIKGIAEETINKTPEIRVYRYRGSHVGNTVNIMEEEEKAKFKILERNYDIPINQIKGYEKFNLGQTDHVDEGTLFRYIVVLDKTCYTINSDGKPEMTSDAQKEYDEYVYNLRHEMVRDEITILDEGYGVGEDELEWHVTGCFMNPDMDNSIVGIIEIDTCVRIESLE